MPESFRSSHGHIVYTDSQAGAKTLVLVHGLPTSKELWNPVLPHLDPNFRIVALDLNDYGQSEKIGRAISHKQRADVLDELRQHLELRSFVLVAHDLGASVAIDYMGAYGDHVQKLVLMSPPVYPDFKEPAVVNLVRKPRIGEGVVRVMRNTLFSTSIKRGLVHKSHLTPELLESFSSAFAGAQGETTLLRNLRWGRPAEIFRDYPDIIRSIRTPTLILQGCEDIYIPADQASRLHADIPASTRLVFIEHGNHFLPIDTPEIVAEEINAFVG